MDSTLSQFENDGTHLTNLDWIYTTPGGSGTQTCVTWPTVANGGHVFMSTYDDSSLKGRLYDVDFNGDTPWSNNTYERVDTGMDTHIPTPNTYDIGQLVANPINDEGTTPNVLLVTKDNGSGNGKPSYVRVLDHSDGTGGNAYGSGYFQNAMSSTSDDLTCTPALIVDYSATGIYWLMDTGKFYIADPTSGAALFGWPKTISTPIKQDLAVDAEGALVYSTSGGVVKAYWGR